MGLRILLVGLVTSLGFEWPSRHEAAAWADSGRAWLATRLDEWSFERPGAGGAAADNGAVASACVASAEGAADEAFSAMVDEMVASFAADQAPAVAVAVVAAPSWEPVEVGDDLYPGLAFALNREAGRAQAPEAVGPEPAAPAPAIGDDPAAASRGERLARALHLTGEAVRAWATLLQAPTVVSVRP